MAVSAAPLTLKQKLFLSIGVPALFLGCLEIGCRVIEATWTGHSKNPDNLELEMPTWMLRDANAVARASELAGREQTVDWLRLFEPGDGFRVHLLPNLDRRITNTFSMIPADRKRGYSIKTNSIGFRGPDLAPEKAPGTYRILVFGDSSSFGWGVDQEDTFSSILQRELGIRLGRQTVEVGNFAIPGDSSAYGRLVFEKFARLYEADAFILGFGANDAKTVFTSHTAQVENFRSHRDLVEVADIARKSALVRGVEKLIGRLNRRAAGTKPKVRVAAVAQQKFAENLLSMTTSVPGKDVLLLSLCTPGNYAKEARKVAQSSGAAYFNGQRMLLKRVPDIARGRVYPRLVEEMREAYPDDLRKNRLFYVTSDGCHPNKLGHRLVADGLLDRFTKLRSNF